MEPQTEIHSKVHYIRYLIKLNEEQRNSRRIHRAEQFKKNRLLSSRANCVIPYLAHNGNYAPIQDDATGENFFFSLAYIQNTKFVFVSEFCTIM